MWPQTKSNPFSHTTVTLDLIHNLIERSILLLLREMLALRSRKWSNQVLEFEKLLVVCKLVVLEQPPCFLPPFFSAMSSIIHPWFYLCVCLSLFVWDGGLGC